MSAKFGVKVQIIVLLHLLASNYSVCKADFVEERDIAVYRSIDIDFENFVRSPNAIFSYKGNIGAAGKGLYDAIIEKFIAIGVNKMSNGPLSNNVTIIFNKLDIRSYKMTRGVFPVNRSVDIVLCHNPNIYQDTVYFRCDHILFEYYNRESYDDTNLYEFIWDQLKLSKPSSKNGSYSFGPPSYHRIKVQTKS